MGLITEEVLIKRKGLRNKDQQHYIDKRYAITKEFNVNVFDLQRGSTILVEVKCDCKDCITLNSKFISWRTYLKYVKEDGKYYCFRCAKKLYGDENLRKVLLIKNGVTFEQWCIENNHQDVLDRWDYELNDYKPNEISYSTDKKIYLKCPNNIHKSELKNIKSFINGQDGSIKCKQCNSFAQWGIDNLGEDFLNKYWDYKKNTIDPWRISKGNNSEKVYIKCQEKDYHDSYDINPNDFINGKRCPYCCNFHGKVHKYDSLGWLFPEVLKIWSDKNIKTPYDYAPFSSEEVIWKCENNNHNDYKRKISTSNICGFRCPSCKFSVGESKINDIFMIYNVNFIYQKKFKKLKGLGGRVLRFDFYLFDYNMCIEYQGKQHYEPIDFAGKGEEWANNNLILIQKHDQIKRDYCKNNSINLLEIPYWDYDNIEEILIKQLNLLTPINNNQEVVAI